MPSASSYTSKIRFAASVKDTAVQLPGGVGNLTQGSIAGAGLNIQYSPTNTPLVTQAVVEPDTSEAVLQESNSQIDNWITSNEVSLPQDGSTGNVSSIGYAGVNRPSLPNYDIYIIIGGSNAVGQSTRNKPLVPNPPITFWGALCPNYNTTNIVRDRVIEGYGDPVDLPFSAGSSGIPRIKMLQNDGSIVDAQHPISSLHGFVTRVDVPIKNDYRTGFSYQQCNPIGFGLSFLKELTTKHQTEFSPVNTTLIVGCGSAASGFMDDKAHSSWGILNHTLLPNGRVKTYSLVQLTREKLTLARSKVGAGSRVNAIILSTGENDASLLTTERFNIQYLPLLRNAISNIRNHIKTLFSANNTPIGGTPSRLPRYNMPLFYTGISTDMFKNRITGVVARNKLYFMQEYLKTISGIPYSYYVTTEAINNYDIDYITISNSDRNILEGDGYLDDYGTYSPASPLKDATNIMFSADSVRILGRRIALRFIYMLGLRS